MSTFKCKMCGGALEIESSASIATCEYCGTTQTLPRIDNEKRANLYDRANHFRRNNEFDKAMGIYEQILNEDNTDAEVYWSLVLCRYGIEYVEDPASHKRVPTVNRAQFTSIFDDDNYKSALQYADSYQKSIYEQEATAINEIQRGILAISQKEEPFDVFICYKETDNGGRRTPDSVLANDLYHQLTQESFKVFFSRITLEDKLGSAYEPYIFAALNSAKVMVVLGTKPEYFNAVWVKNEWARYLSLIKNGANKILIPAYKDMDPYDLPEEFSHLQAQDMSKLGFMQDLIRGIKKITDADKQQPTVIKETVVSTGGNGNTETLLKRVFMFLEDGDWNSANEYCEKVLDIEPENARAYLGKLMANTRKRKIELLKDCKYSFDDDINYQKIMRFGDEKLKTTLAEYIAYINERNENERLENLYASAKEDMAIADTEESYKAAAELFESVSEYKDSSALAKACYEKAEGARKDAIIANGKANMTLETIANYEEAIELFKSVSGWKDADENIVACQKKIDELKAKEEAERLEFEHQVQIAREKAEIKKKRNKKILAIATPIICIAIVVGILLNYVIIPNGKYNDAVELMKSEKYEEAIAAFGELNGYKDSTDKIEECNICIYGEKVWNKLKNVKVGSYIKFGTYEQDNDTSNGKEDIEWLALEKEGSRVLVVSKYALDCKQYNTSYTDVTWETCTLRKWLNNEFINSAFSKDEQKAIPTVTVSADANPEYSTDPGNATQDKVFLLSIKEANKYFNSNERECKPTAYAVANGAYESDSGNCYWWLRSPGDTQDIAAYINHGGGVYEHGYYVSFGDVAVRPALWIDLNS